MLCMLFCMLEAVEGKLCLLEVLEVMRCCAALYTGGCGGWALFAGGVEVLDAMNATLYG